MASRRVSPASDEPLPLDLHLRLLRPVRRSSRRRFHCHVALHGCAALLLLNKEKLRWKRRWQRRYLRLLLDVVIGPTSFADLLKFEDVVYLSYRAACAARRLLADGGEHDICLTEAEQIPTGDQLRRLFVFMFIQATVANPPALLDRHSASLAMMPVITSNALKTYSSTIKPSACGRSTIFVSFFAANDRTWVFFDLSKLAEDKQCAQDAEEAPARLSHDQRNAFDELLRAVDLSVVDQMRDDHLQEVGPQHVSFLLAHGGTGNTFVEECLLGSNGVASQGRTHGAFDFRIPLDTSPTTTCPVDRESDLVLMLRTTKLIVWDEAPMAHRFAVEAMDRLLRDLGETEELFVGKPDGTSGGGRRRGVTMGGIWWHPGG
ncbi:BZ3500_MvSof-1268-A1-R1_Chr3-1g05805 [Microbotryum saponariae]|uniref:ATP-dependent DNA helicase n=1 Tax=Microbotryum saponariae TaxID=289078 RepID=A0A2X0L2M6_9BASI|nr:BZ3500_MvSof-1268-A1-R1_Chr3-1g05805 [Microbotryum saponariae]SDA04995.1 BZ3501_MvSof-1269-A2-R1_Chr3-1g05475 [Microbotryum saponariae]